MNEASHRQQYLNGLQFSWRSEVTRFVVPGAVVLPLPLEIFRAMGFHIYRDQLFEIQSEVVPAWQMYEAIDAAQKPLREVLTEAHRCDDQLPLSQLPAFTGMELAAHCAQLRIAFGQHTVRAIACVLPSMACVRVLVAVCVLLALYNRRTP